MLTFDYARADDVADAVARGAAGGRYLGGGTNLVDLMRETIERPHSLVDVTALSRGIAPTDDGGVLIGAAATNTAVAEDRFVRAHHPLLARAILAGASAQIRNMATIGGNLLQRTRCYYFYDDAARCNKRVPGAGCDARSGFNRIHAVLGASEQCVATHPSDLCVALAALGARIHVEGPGGARVVPFVDFHRLPGDTPHVETVLDAGDLVTAIEVPGEAAAPHAAYRKVRDRASYAFALVSVAATLDVEDGRIAAVRLALGGVAHKPWRASVAEAALRDGPATAEAFRAAATREMAAAVALRDNGFKIDLAVRTITAVLEELSA